MSDIINEVEKVVEAVAPVAEAAVEAAAPAPAQGLDNLPNDVSALKGMLHNAVAKLMAHSQTVQELIKANMDMRAALHLLQADKAQLEAYIKATLSPAANAPAAEEAPAAEAPAAEAPAAEAPAAEEAPASDAAPVEANADTVSA